MKFTIFKSFLTCAVMACSLNAHSAAMLIAPGSAIVGDSFEVSVQFDVEPDLALDELVLGFDFTVTDLFGLSFIGADVAPFDAPLLPPLDPNVVAGTSFFGVDSDPLTLAVLSFTADSVGTASGSILGLVNEFQGLFVDSFQAGPRFLDIRGSFELNIEEATSVPAPASLALLAAGLLLLRKRKA